MMPVCTRTNFNAYDIYAYGVVGFLENKCNLITKKYDKQLEMPLFFTYN